jgi:asparagine synthase (glutamine-hydrolysing)
MFKKCGIENAICFSYGKQGNTEAEISRSVAKALGYKWLFCPYDSWYNWFRGEQYSSYIEYASGLSSISHEQDWPATKKILDDISDTNKEDMVFVPGHSADFLAGSHIPDELLFANENTRMYDALIVEAILSHHYNQWYWRSVCPHLKDSFSERIREILSVYPPIEDKSQAIGAFETWDFESRQARFIVNSVRVYEFWGCKWMLPLWDNELTDFFSKIKLELRIRKTLYRSTLLKHIFTNQLKELAEIPISGLPLLESDTERNKKSTHSSLLNSVYPTFRKFIPDFIVNSHRASINLQNDSMNLYDIYTERGTGTTKLEDIIPLSVIDRMPTSVKKILRRNRKRPTTALSINGLHAAYHIALLLMD